MALFENELESDNKEEAGQEELPADTDKIDLNALAEEIYALLRKELILERERFGWY